MERGSRRSAGLVLAGGAGRRFGGPKALAQVDGERLVDRAVRILTEGGCDPLVVVSGAVELDVPGAQVVPNPRWDTGMGSSLRAGLAALAELGRGYDTEAFPVDSCVVLLVDTPWIGPDAVRRLIESGSAARPGAVIATYDGRRGHPVRLDRDVWAEVAALAVGDTGAKAWLRAQPDRVVEVDCTGLGDPRDVDRVEDL